VLYADETPARAAGGLRYVHIACTEFLAALHAGGRSAADIDAGGILPGYAGTIVRDGYAGFVPIGPAELSGKPGTWYERDPTAG
jgi:transposase